MRRKPTTNWRFLLSVGLALGLSPKAPAQAPPDDDLKARIERLEKQNQELLEALKRLQTVPTSPITGFHQPSNALPAAEQGGLGKEDVKKIVGDYLKGQEEKKKAADAALKQKEEEEGYKVGTNLKMNVRWNNGLFFETPNKDFVAHFGMRFQNDAVYFTQDPKTKLGGQPGSLQDGDFFRRVRIQTDGVFWEVFEWNLEAALETANTGVVGLDEFWVGITQLPIFGTFRFGHNKVPQGLEGDQVSSSKAMTFLERASYCDAFYNNFATGLWASNNYLDERVTWSAMWYRTDRGTNLTGDSFADGEFGYTGRATCLPYYEHDGRCLVHLGGSATWRKSQNPPPGLVGPGVVQFRARTQIRDFNGEFGTAPNPGNSNRWVDTGAIIADSATVYASEFLWIHGPFSVQAEYGWAFANDAFVGGKSQGDLGFHGGYVQLSYFLTGENRTYDKRFGKLGTQYIARANTPFWFVRDEDRRWSLGRGAWEIAARYSHLDLNSGLVQGGQFDGLEFGVNWHLNNNLKVQFDYLHQNRYDLKAGQFPGTMDGFGIRTQFFF